MGTVRWRLVFLYCLAMSVNKVIPSQEIMQKLTAGFAMAFENCKTELNIEDQVIQDFYNFWRQDYELVNKDLGCMLLCMSSKFEMIDGDMKFHHGNAHVFAKAHGADDKVAKQLVTMIHDCETLHLGVTDHCSRVLEISKCFRTKIDGLNWVPSMEIILDEIININ